MHRLHELRGAAELILRPGDRFKTAWTILDNKLKNYLRSKSIGEWLAYPPKLTVELGSYVHGEAHGWAR